MISKNTLNHRPKPSVMLVGLDDVQTGLCAQVIPVEQLRVGHAQAACERMLVTRPLLVVIPSKFQGADRDAVRERSEDIGAELLQLQDGESPEELKKRTDPLLARARARRAMP